jgi:hypothetical protein
VHRPVYRTDCPNPEQRPAALLRELEVLKTHTEVDVVPDRPTALIEASRVVLATEAVAA